MIVLLSPAKNLNFDAPSVQASHSQPEFLKETRALAKVTKSMTKGQLKKLMHINDKLATLNFERFQAFKTPFTPDNAKQAALAFSGDAYQGLNANELSNSDLEWAQDHLRILSGFYGLLRPLDLIQPYRLEMGTSLKNPEGKDLYAFWGDKLTRKINQTLNGADEPIVVNLASNEYFNALDKDKLKARIVTPQFKDIKNGKARFLMFFAKKARGIMACYIIQNRLEQPDDIKKFEHEGYCYNAELTKADNWVFSRESKK